MKHIDDVIEIFKYLNSKLKETEKIKKEIEERKSAINENPNSSIIMLLIFLPITIWAFTQNTDFSKEEKS